MGGAGQWGEIMDQRSLFSGECLQILWSGSCGQISNRTKFFFQNFKYFRNFEKFGNVFTHLCSLKLLGVEWGILM